MCKWALPVVLLFCAQFVTEVNAAVITFGTAAGTKFSSLDVDAQASFTTSTNQVQVVLKNLEVDPKSAQQVISGLQFTLSTGQTSGTLLSSSGIERTVNNDTNATFTDGNAVSTGWALSTVGSSLMLDLLGTPEAPQHTIIGPPNASTNDYGNANSSLMGTHDPFMGLSATFTITVPGVTSASTISAATFQFNTSPGSNATGTTVPEPAAMVLAGSICLAMMRRR